jgi:hypothetical protein
MVFAAFAQHRQSSASFSFLYLSKYHFLHKNVILRNKDLTLFLNDLPYYKNMYFYKYVV